MVKQKLRLGTVAFSPKGKWNAETEYKRLNVVHFLASSYYAKKENVGQTPTLDSEYWGLLVEGGDVVNNPDEEDITTEVVNNEHVLKFADKKYRPEDFSGKGYKRLRKNIQKIDLAVTKITVNSAPTKDGEISVTINNIDTHISLVKDTHNTPALVAQAISDALVSAHTDYSIEVTEDVITLTRKHSGEVASSAFDVADTGVTLAIEDSTKSVKRNILSADMINQSNCTYEIMYDFNLDGETVNVLENCTLKFDGGSLSNGIIVGNDTCIIGHKNILYSVCLNGSYCNDVLYANWYKLYNDGIQDDTEQLRLACMNTIPKVILPTGKCLISDYIYEVGLRVSKTITGSSAENMSNSEGRHSTTIIYDNDNVESGIITVSNIVNSNNFRTTIQNIDFKIKHEGSVLYLTELAKGISFFKVQDINVHYSTAYTVDCKSDNIAVTGNRSVAFWLHKCFECYFDRVAIYGAKICWLFDTSSHADWVDDVYISNSRCQGGIILYNKGAYHGRRSIINLECESFGENLIRGESGYIDIVGLHLENSNKNSDYDLSSITVTNVETINNRLQLTFSESVSSKLLVGNIIELYNDRFSKFAMVMGITNNIVQTNLRVMHTYMTGWKLKRYVRIPIVGSCNVMSSSFTGSQGNQPCAVLFDGNIIQTGYSSQDSSHNVLNPIYENTGWTTMTNSYKLDTMFKANNVGAAFSKFTSNINEVWYDTYRLSPLGIKDNKSEFDIVWVKHNTYQSYWEYIPIAYRSDLTYADAKALGQNFRSMCKGWFDATIVLYVFKEKQITITVHGDKIPYPGTILTHTVNLKEGVNVVRLSKIKLNEKARNIGIHLYNEPDAGIINAELKFYDSISEAKGITSERPTAPEEGFEFYDSTLKKKILWNGTTWVNIDGTELAAVTSNE